MLALSYQSNGLVPPAPGQKETQPYIGRHPDKDVFYIIADDKCFAIKHCDLCKGGVPVSILYLPIPILKKVQKLIPLFIGEIQAIYNFQEYGYHPSADFSARELMKIVDGNLATDGLRAEAEEKLNPTPKLSIYRPKPKRNPEDECFIYLMQDSRNGYHKIGFSVEPNVRERTLQSEVPFVKIIKAWKGKAKEERLLHEKYASLRVRGEWFNLEKVHLIEIYQYFKGREEYMP